MMLCAARLLVLFAFSVSLLMGLSRGAMACTTAVVSGKATPDGRPLLWKNRDFWQRDNEVVYSDRGRYAFVGIANAEATDRMRMGTNVAGLCIENSTSRDLGEPSTPGPNNGDLITLALENCATVEDFRKLLEKTNTEGRRTRGNFGVIDAQGGAMMFEVGPDSFRVFDANDPHDAPEGFIVRSNFSETARQQAAELAPQAIEDMYSGQRYSRAFDLCLAARKQGQLDLEYLLQAVCRDVQGCHQSAFHTAWGDAASETQQTFLTGSTLNRNMTVAAVVFQGVAQQEDPRLTTMWALLGEPMFTVAVPCWAAQRGVADCLNGDGTSTLCDAAIRLRQANYDASGERLQSKRLAQVTRALDELETRLIARVQQRKIEWRSDPPSGAQLLAEHQQASQLALQTILEMVDQYPSQTSPRLPGSSDNAVVEFPFDEPDGTRLAACRNASGGPKWSGGMTDCRVDSGGFRLSRNDVRSVTRYVEIDPSIRVRPGSDGKSFASAGWLVIEIAGWNLVGSETNETVRFGFSSRPDSHLHTAAVSIRRTSDSQVAIGGEAFGDGGTSIEETLFPATLRQPITLILELDKVRGNPDEGDFGGEYRIFARSGSQQSFQQLGSTGKVRRLRNGNAIHFQVSGNFADVDEFFDIDRIWFTANSPLH